MLLVAVVGCSDDVQIRRYTVPKTASSPAASTEEPAGPAVPSRMLAAIVPNGGLGWFFKLTGPEETTKELHDPFVNFLKTVEFKSADDEKPTWKLPEDWKQKAGSELRYATIEIPTAAAPVELTVIPLPLGDASRDEYTLSNVNRWREQLQLAPITKEQLGEQTKTVELPNDHRAIYVDYVGLMKANTMGRPPFAANAPPAQPAAPANSPRPSSDLKYDLPAGWAPSAGNAFSKAAFKVEDGGKSVEITVTSAGGDSRANINRWRGQIKLPPLESAELAKEIQPIKLGERTGEYVSLIGPADANPREAILGVIVADGGTSWFIKLKGDVALAEREKKNFEAFVQSLRF